MYPLVVLVVALLLIGGGVRQRKRLGRSTHRAFGTKLAMLALGGAGAIVLVAFPAVYLLVRHAAYGGPIESNLPPGVSVDGLLGVLAIGVVMVLNHAFYGYVEHINSQANGGQRADIERRADMP